MRVPSADQLGLRFWPLLPKIVRVPEPSARATFSADPSANAISVAVRRPDGAGDVRALRRRPRRDPPLAEPGRVADVEGAAPPVREAPAVRRPRCVDAEDEIERAEREGLDVRHAGALDERPGAAGLPTANELGHEALFAARAGCRDVDHGRAGDLLAVERDVARVVRPVGIPVVRERSAARRSPGELSREHEDEHEPEHE